MDDIQRVLSWFTSGRLLRPDASLPTTVHLARVLAQLNGASLGLTGPEREILTAIGDSDHLVFVLADGLGLNLVQSEPDASFLKQNLVLELRSVFPSSTAPSLTSLATGLWPAQHGVPAWFVFLPNKAKHVTALPFVERFSGRPLNEATVAPELFARPALTADYKRDTLALLPRQIADSVYTRYVTGGRP
ncbi:MAG TPA: alkaline phosphatase family protein, partial [Dehalococcoidia bacterium]|nr:alkaline phosphatase family protein [Dehalococcoidia bacterium]